MSTMYVKWSQNLTTSLKELFPYTTLFRSLCLTCVVSFLSLYTCFFLYTTCLCFTLDALMNLV